MNCSSNRISYAANTKSSSSSSHSSDKRTVFQSTLVRVVTETDHNRAYRCVPVVSNDYGHKTTLNDRPTNSFTFHVQIADLELTASPPILSMVDDQDPSKYNLTIFCGEKERPMDPLIRLEINLFHEGSVIASAEYGLDEHCFTREAYSTLYSDDDVVTSDADQGDDAINNATVWQVDNDNMVTSSNADFSTGDRLFLEAHYTMVDCRRSGTYKCQMVYTFQVEGANPVSHDMTKDVNVRILYQLAINIFEEQVHYLESTDTIQLACFALLAPGVNGVALTFDICVVKTGCLSLPRIDCHGSNKEIYCVCKKTKGPAPQPGCVTQVKYAKYSNRDMRKKWFRCRARIGELVIGETWKPITIIGEVSPEATYGNSLNTPPFHSSYNNVLVMYIIPSMVLFGLILFTIGLFVVTWQRYQRVYKSLSRTVLRNKINRTDHFRKRNRGKAPPAEPVEPRISAEERRSLFFRVLNRTLADKTEWEITLEERKRCGIQSKTRPLIPRTASVRTRFSRSSAFTRGRSLCCRKSSASTNLKNDTVGVSIMVGKGDSKNRVCSIDRLARKKTGPRTRARSLSPIRPVSRL